MQITIIYPKNELCRLVIRVLDRVGIDVSENEHLVKTEIYKNVGIGEIIMSPEFSEYFARFYGSQIRHAAASIEVICDLCNDSQILICPGCKGKDAEAGCARCKGKGFVFCPKCSNSDTAQDEDSDENARL